MTYSGHEYEECPDSTLDHKKATIGRKLSRVLSLFRKKSTEEEHKDISSEPVYEELIYGNITDISSPQYSFSTLDRLDSGYSANFTDRLEPSFAEILRLGRPYPQVVGGPGWWVRGFRHRAPTLFLPTEELTPIEPAYIDTAVKIDEKANYFRTHFLNREHINLVGYSRVWGPLVLSILQDEPGYKLILRSVSGTETREVTEPDESSDWATAVFGSLSQDTFSQVVCLDAWPRILAYDEHSINTVHNIGLILQKEKQFCSTTLLENHTVTKGLSQFLASFSSPVRGTAGATAYYVRYRDNDIVIHPAPIIRTNHERRERVLTSLVQIVFQEDPVPFSPDLMGEDKTICYIVVQPLDTTGSEGIIRYKIWISIIADSDIAEFGPKIPEPSVITQKQLYHVLLPMLINANNNCIKSRKMNSLRGRARAELFASLFETLSGWNGANGGYTGSKISQLIKPQRPDGNAEAMPNNEIYMGFISSIGLLDIKQGSQGTLDSGNSSGNYTSSDDCSFIHRPPPPDKLPESVEFPVEALIEDVKEMKIQIEQKSAEVKEMRTQLQCDRNQLDAKGEKITRRKSSSTSGIGTDSSSQRRDNGKQHRHHRHHNHHAHHYKHRYNPIPDHHIPEQRPDKQNRTKKRNSLGRTDTMKCRETGHRRDKLENSPKQGEYARRKLEKKQKLLERAKSLSDISRIHNGYAPTRTMLDSVDSTTSLDSLSDMDFSSAIRLIKNPTTKKLGHANCSRIHRAQSHSVIDHKPPQPTKSIIRKPFNGSPVFGTIKEEKGKKAKHNVSFRN